MKKLLKKIIEAISSKPHISRAQEWSMFQESEDFKL
jgi:hypothetical protein